LSGGAGDGLDGEDRVAAVDARQGVVEWARKASHSFSVGVRYSSLDLVDRRRAMNARWASIASAG
jgi:hypothetical protein